MKRGDGRDERAGEIEHGGSRWTGAVGAADDGAVLLINVLNSPVKPQSWEI